MNRSPAVGLTSSRREECLRAFVGNLEDLDAPIDLRERAAGTLTARLRNWHGDFMPLPSRFAKHRRPTADSAPVTIPTDPTELLIVRAISMTTPAAQFGVSPNGEVFTAYRNGWTINDRIYVTRLSWLLDEVGDLFNHRRAYRGGRFYLLDGTFFMADGKATFANVVEVPGSDALSPRGSRSHAMGYSNAAARHRAPRVRWSSPLLPRICSIHEVAFNSAGLCDRCSDLMGVSDPSTRAPQKRRPPARPSKPWWRFW